MPVAGADAEGKPFMLDYDEGVRLKPDLEKMSSLAPASSGAGGVITAANSSQISDGAALLLIADRESGGGRRS